MKLKLTSSEIYSLFVTLQIRIEDLTLYLNEHPNPVTGDMLQNHLDDNDRILKRLVNIEAYEIFTERLKNKLKGE